jgi:hypothetical protein
MVESRRSVAALIRGVKAKTEFIFDGMGCGNCRTIEPRRAEQL